jgi:hypothetical protein
MSSVTDRTWNAYMVDLSAWDHASLTAVERQHLHRSVSPFVCDVEWLSVDHRGNNDGSRGNNDGSPCPPRTSCSQVQEHETTRMMKFTSDVTANCPVRNACEQQPICLPLRCTSVRNRNEIDSCDYSISEGGESLPKLSRSRLHHHFTWEILKCYHQKLRAIECS